MRGGVLRPECRASIDRTAAIGKRSDGLGEVFEKRVARKELVPHRKTMVDAYVRLVLIVGLVAKPSEIVGKPGRSWLRIAVKQRCGSRIECARRDQIPCIGKMIGGTKNHALAHLDGAPGGVGCGDRNIPARRGSHCPGRCTVERRTQKS